MGRNDVDGGDMPDPRLSAEELAAILEGTAPELADHPVAGFVARSREALAADKAPTPSGELEALMRGRAVTDPASVPYAAVEVLDLTAAAEPHPRRTPVFAAFTTFLGSFGGKLVIGTAAVAAAAGGAHAADLVDVPLLPDDESTVVEIDDDTADDDADDSPDDDAADDDADDSPDDDTDSPDDTDDDADDIADDAGDDDDADDDDAPDDDADDDSDDEPDDDADDIADDADDIADDADDESDDDLTTTTTASAGIADQTLAYTVDGVGTTTVRVSGGVLSLVSAVPAAGWSLDEAGMDGREAESEYVQGTIEVDIDIQVDNGLLRVRVRERDDADDSETEFFEYFDSAGNSLGDLGRDD